MKTLSTLLIITALIAGTISCAPTQHNLTISSIAGGSVTNPGEGTFTYDAGAAVDLVAEAEEGYQFVNWTGDVDNTGNANDATTTITINGDYSITANFAVIPPAQYDLTISSTVGGEVTAPGELIFNYDEGTDVDLVAEAEEGYHFVNWTGDVDTIANVNAATTVISMHGDYAITTNFAPDWPLDWRFSSCVEGDLPEQKGKAEKELPGRNTELSFQPRHSCHRTCYGVSRELTVTAWR